jgi:hypothetical protein
VVVRAALAVSALAVAVAVVARQAPSLRASGTAARSFLAPRTR